LANVLVWGRDQARVAGATGDIATALREAIPDDWEVLGPSPSPLSRLKGVWRWHALVKAPNDADLAAPLALVLKAFKPHSDVSIACDVDPLDLL
jgi:primosomal protein N' (replication factor Y)